MRWMVVLLAACTAGTGELPDVVDSSVRVSPCAADGDDQPSGAAELTPGIPTTRLLCPVGDHDWLRVSLPEGAGLLGIELSLPDSGSTRVQPTYTVWDSAGEVVLATPRPGEHAQIGAPLQVFHPAPSDTVLIQIGDQSDDAADPEVAYTLTVTARTEPDANERNDGPLQATPYTSGRSEGFVASRGDEDWYAVPSSAAGLLEVRFDAPPLAWTPSLQVISPTDQVILAVEVPTAVIQPTSLRWRVALEGTGAHHVVVSAAAGEDHDPEVGYDLELIPTEDPDAFEPNDHPTLASDQGLGLCGDDWDAVADHTAFLAAAGDIDWYRVGLQGCDPGVLEATVTLDDPDGAPLSFQPELRAVRAVADAPCAIDQDCTELPRTCGHDLDCEGVGNLCTGNGQCAGAGVCLPDGLCGANLLVEIAPVGVTDQLTLSAPLRDLDEVWVTVADHQGDAWMDGGYHLDIATRADPDPFEPNDVYTAGPPTSANSSRHDDRAAELPVHDCTTGDCCDADTWEEGFIASRYDQDWFRYRHPCPGGDCMLRMHWRFDAGPVDVFTQVYRGTSLWFDFLTGTRELVHQNARAGEFGGLTASDECFYAYNGHNGNPYWYHLVLRDTVYVNSQDRQGGSWDWSADQGYGVCLEKLADSCFVPCTLTQGGCTP